MPLSVFPWRPYSYFITGQHTSLQQFLKCSIFLLQVVSTSLLVDHIEQRLRTEPARLVRPNSAISVRSLISTNRNRLLATRTSRCLCHELALAALLHGEEPEDGLRSQSANSIFDKRIDKIATLTSSTLPPTVNNP
jgi:hypothetical protein